MTDYIVEDLWEFGTAPNSEVMTAPLPARLARQPHGHPATTAIVRPRLSLALNEGLPPLTIVEAPAGFGKSRLLDQWRDELAAGDIPALRISAQADGATIDSDASRVSSSATVIDHHALLSFAQNWLASRDHGVVIIDDAHLLSDDIVREIYAFFLRAASPDHVLMVASRHRHNVALARARAHGQVRDLDASALRFSQDEWMQLAERALPRTASGPVLAEIHRMVGGWPVALAACLKRMIELGPDAALHELTHGSRIMDDFFDEEVIRPLDPLLAQFLIDISALGVLTADVCDAAREAEDSAALLDDALRSGLFIEAIDGYRREYRLHLLFAQYLQCALMRQGRGRHHAIVLRGAVWFERQGRWLAAFDCLARADAWDMAAKLLDRHGLRACLSGHGPQVTAMALRLPHDILLLHPRVAILAARGANTGWQFGLVEDFLQLAYTTTSKDRPDEVETLALHSRMLMAQYEDNQCEAGRKCLMLLERAGTLDHYTRGTIFGSLLYARREQFDFTDAAELEATGIREFNLSERSVGMVWHLSVAGPTHAMRGDLATGARRLEEAADAAARLPDANGMASVPGLLLAELCYERNEIAQSRALIDRHHPAPLVGFIDQYVAGYVTGARLLRLAGDVEAAHRRLDEGMALAEARTLERLRQSMVGERIRLLLASGEPQRALEIGKRENLLGEPDALGPGTGATTRDDMRAASWFRLALLRGEHEAAIGLGKLWKRFALKAGAITPAMRWEILLAQAYAALAQPARSQRELRNALGRAVTGGHVRSFIDEGTPVRRLLQDQLEASTIQTSPTDALVVSLLDAFAAEAIADADALSVLQASESGQTTSFTPLTRTQIEILQMASAGLQNREIARRIGMTEGSVKWYMQQIFNKIGVRKRAGALERARSLGLLA